MGWGDQKQELAHGVGTSGKACTNPLEPMDKDCPLGEQAEGSQASNCPDCTRRRVLLFGMLNVGCVSPSVTSGLGV